MRPPTFLTAAYRYVIPPTSDALSVLIHGEFLLRQSIIPRMKSEVLQGCNIVFSGVIPLDKRPETCVEQPILHCLNEGADF